LTARKSFFSIIPKGLSALLLCGLFAVASAHPAEAKYASMVVDADTGEVLHAVNADNRNYPASLTKMMTLYLLFDQMEAGKVKLTDRMPVSAHAAGQAPSKLGLRPGQTLMVEDAILGLCTKSANDAAVTVGEFIGGSEPAFAELMTRKAHELGMRQTTFRNASGLPNLGQFSSARDMVTLARALMHNHGREYHYFSTHTFTYNGETMRNHNHLMEWYEGTDGIKTGYIAASGFNLVASVKRNDRRLIGVVFGGTSAPARDRHMAKLMDAAFARTPGSAGVELAELPQQTGDAEAEDDEDTATPAKHAVAHKVAAADDEEKDAPTKHVMKAMAASKVALAKPRHPAPVESGDAEDDNWGIQVGAYAQPAKAKQAAAAAMHKLGNLVSDADVAVSKAKQGRHMMYRARLVGLAEDDARAACKRLSKAHASCSVIKSGVSVASR
jgi:D-alanyl-D-alanine carboxypeptidase